ncbi:hypothetical protein GLOTRDRAFT_112100 [Gloeophyllum trabeum ATCC 11539]|uniref:DUF6534 domain-containing protein n=1 Tax=Gloeophyllum trabeum (strain ATCC 11539 / FP-39264 / Madison 617) TaxID=670483 RepID=S7RJM0_GLOTA|nr:uncharacterized protein GLOTRDRAFT_112100 [Gloeophyllum trabeum ATCC 11539]EPQ52834.1 hypothetical protein GLOTRDRAFT_112100 [Gloeophyllum trabeum ATCC 11539]
MELPTVPTLEGHPVASTFGILLISLVISAIFYGVTLLQTYIYYRQYPQDPLIQKIIVAFLWFLDTMHLIFCTITIYWFLVANYGKPETLDSSTWSMKLQTDFNGLVGLIVQFFFARRVWLLSFNWLLVSTICILSALHFVLGIVFTVEAFQLGHISKYRVLTWITCLGFSAAAVADILIAAAMCYYLAQRRTEFRKTNDVITTLMLYSINTGLLTSIVATACVISFAISPTSFIWLSFFWVLGKCYVNSLLGMLNSRQHVREKGHQRPTFVELDVTNPSDSSGRSGRPRRTDNGENMGIAISVETTTKHDFPQSSSALDIRAEFHKPASLHDVDV